MKCLRHDWSWDISDPRGCPVCYGVNLEVERRIHYLERVQTWHRSKVAAWYEGFETAELRILEAFKKSDSACSEWAIGIVENIDRELN
jgi:hypothetical protein